MGLGQKNSLVMCGELMFELLWPEAGKFFGEMQMKISHFDHKSNFITHIFYI